MYHRVLVFSTDPIISVNVLLDNQDVGAVDHVTGPLYVAKWQPLDYSIGIHSITVIAKVVKTQISKTCDAMFEIMACTGQRRTHYYNYSAVLTRH